VIVENVDITTTDPDWTDLMTLNAPDMDAGSYALSFSLQFNMDSTNRSFMYRFSTDGGATWGAIYQHESKDKSNTDVVEVFDIWEHTAIGTIDVRCQVTRESAADCLVLKGIIACERKA
jgi:hypothetical protein